jgi:hypothetical protein
MWPLILEQYDWRAHAGHLPGPRAPLCNTGHDWWPKIAAANSFSASSAIVSCWAFGSGKALPAPQCKSCKPARTSPALARLTPPDAANNFLSMVKIADFRYFGSAGGR